MWYKYLAEVVRALVFIWLGLDAAENAGEPLYLILYFVSSLVVLIGGGIAIDILFKSNPNNSKNV